MDGKTKRGSKNAAESQGNASSDYRDIIAAACDWQYGADAFANDIEDEGQEEDLAFGVPHETMDFDKAHPGFKAVQSHIQSEGYSKQAAGAILANATRHASKKAHKANPNLNKVKGH